ncbi:MAG TPA: recombinase family protein [Stellaceae bacterium]|jgi:hypothetical protein|nr:recombinase family protein [Stellaceae bacterium]
MLPVEYDRNLPPNRTFGYARVSTYGQTLEAQLDEVRGAGCTKIFREKVTGAHSDRRELFKMLEGPRRRRRGDRHPHRPRAQQRLRNPML